MEFLLPEWAPNIHPMLVHFPIALLLIAAVGSLASFFVPDKWWDEQKNTVLYVLGALSAIVVYYTGQAAADSVFLEAGAQSVLSEHAGWAEYTLWFFVLYAILRGVFHWFGLMKKISFKIVAFITVLPGLFMLYETAEYGGKMVFGYGVGTGQLVQQDTESAPAADSLKGASSSFIQKENGWNWDITERSVGDLIANFRWIEGSVQGLNPQIVSGEESFLRLNASGETSFFVTNSDYQNVQIDYYLNLDDFSGEIELVHHVQDARNYDFVSLNSDGTIRQGRMQNGETTIFEEGTFDPEGRLFVRVVADGTHFRGYVNREMKVHGHGDAPQSGAAGMKLNGNGAVLISQIELTQLN
ncbi:DUF2231 domain-containing protein [Gracilimonas mengyeensis]|uniref:Uncharacterized membrane protein n=1 Tax=Gracilimonas mengyeensis TaxID=1302730 RepID=A0A521CXC8_9BACT|nr:DUF2231 domain-containing protein [Gracilimonas mengyeensis]SMO64078.1 Uncharacterized membrane protein [Gracilimonas mengyeensis]